MSRLYDYYQKLRESRKKKETINPILEIRVFRLKIKVCSTMNENVIEIVRSVSEI